MRLQQLFDALAARGFGVDIKVYRVSDGEDAYDTLMRLHSRKDSNQMTVLVDLPTQQSAILLDKQVSHNIYKSYGVVDTHMYFFSWSNFTFQAAYFT